MAVIEKTTSWHYGNTSQDFPGPASANPNIVLVGEDGQVAGGPSYGAPGAGGTTISGTGTGGTGSSGIGTGGSGTTSTSSSTSPFAINITWDSSVASAPAGFTTGVMTVVQYLQSLYVDPVTININVGYGEVGGNALGSGTLGSSLTYLANYTYSQITGALSADATSTADASAVASLPGSSPVSSANYWTSTAEAKALGLMGASSAVDGYVGFSSTYTFDYNNSDGVSTGTYDFFGTVAHEITEVMGRMLLVGATIGGKSSSYDPLDLFHFSSPGVRTFTASSGGYFSADSGTTKLGDFNTVSGGDVGDWGSGMGNDAFNAYSSSGVVNAVSSADITVLDTIGWTLAITASPPTAPTGVAFSGAPYKAGTATNSGLAGDAAIAKASQVGGTTTDNYTYTLGGTDAVSFYLTSASNVGSLSAASLGVAGATNGMAYNLTVTAYDSTQNVSTPAAPLGVIIGVSGDDTINLSTVLGGTTTTPEFIYGLAGNDKIDAVGMASKLWFAGGAGADTMTGGSNTDTFMYGAASESTATLMDIINNFSAAADLIDLTGLGVALSYAGKIGGSGRLAAHSIGYQVNNGNTFIYVNTSGGSEKLATSDMKIELMGNISITGSNFQHL